MHLNSVTTPSKIASGCFNPLVVSIVSGIRITEWLFFWQDFSSNNLFVKFFFENFFLDCSSLVLETKSPESPYLCIVSLSNMSLNFRLDSILFIILANEYPFISSFNNPFSNDTFSISFSKVSILSLYSLTLIAAFSYRVLAAWKILLRLEMIYKSREKFFVKEKFPASAKDFLCFNFRL